MPQQRQKRTKVESHSYQGFEGYTYSLQKATHKRVHDYQAHIGKRSKIHHKNNTFKARMIFHYVDPKNKNEMIEQEEEMQVDEAWVRDKFSNEDVQHIVINMRLEDNWIQAPRDIKVWIGKHNIFRVRYTGPRQRSVIGSEAVPLRLREKQGMRSGRARGAAIRWAYKKK